MMQTEDLAPIGVPELDADHHRLTHLLRMVIADVERGCTELPALTRQAWAIVADLAAHCSREESLMERIAHRERCRHERAHIDMIEGATAALQEVRDPAGAKVWARRLLRAGQEHQLEEDLLLGLALSRAVR